jgi:hypothetical protein
VVVVSDSRDLNIVLKAHDKASGVINKASGVIGGRLGKLTSTASKVGAAFAGLYVVGQAAGFLVECGKAAEEEARAFAVLSKVVTNVTDASDSQLAALDKYILKTSIATGVTDDLLMKAMVPLVNSTKSIAEAQDVMATAMDTSTARGLDLNAVSVALSKAHDGNLTALKKLGIQTKDASGKTLTFAEMLDQLKTSYGGATAAAAKNNVWTRLGIIWQETKEAIGTALLPKLQALGDWITANPDKIAEGLGKITGACTTIFGAVSGVGSIVASVFGNMGPMLVPMIAAICAALMGAMGPLGLLATAIAGVMAGFARLDAEISANYAEADANDTKALERWQKLNDDWIAGGKKGPAPSRPVFALGGIVPGSGPVPVIAHGGEPILPRNNPARALQLIMQSGVLSGLHTSNTFAPSMAGGYGSSYSGGGRANVSVPVTLVLSGREVGRALATTTVNLGRGGAG